MSLKNSVLSEIIKSIYQWSDGNKAGIYSFSESPGCVTKEQNPANLRSLLFTGFFLQLSQFQQKALRSVIKQLSNHRLVR